MWELGRGGSQRSRPEKGLSRDWDLPSTSSESIFLFFLIFFKFYEAVSVFITLISDYIIFYFYYFQVEE